MKAFKFIWYGIILGAVFGGHMAHASIADRAYFFSYLSKSFVSNPSYKQEKPFVIPSTLPEPAELADSMASKINPDTFLRGASTSEHQCSKRCTPEACSWSRYAKEHNLPQPTDAQYPMDLWKHYRSYIDYAKDVMKLNALRFSIEWALVQPKDQDGYKISGYLPWTLASNYEWPSLENNNHREYGICAINAEDPSKLIAKEGSRSYLAFVERMAEHSDKKR